MMKSFGRGGILIICRGSTFIRHSSSFTVFVEEWDYKNFSKFLMTVQFSESYSFITQLQRKTRYWPMHL